MAVSSNKMRAFEAASYLRISVTKLAHMRVTGDGPPYAKVGNRLVIYDKDDLDQWLGTRLCRSTAEYGSRT